MAKLQPDLASGRIAGFQHGPTSTHGFLAGVLAQEREATRDGVLNGDKHRWRNAVLAGEILNEPDKICSWYSSHDKLKLARIYDQKNLCLRNQVKNYASS